MDSYYWPLLHVDLAEASGPVQPAVPLSYDEQCELLLVEFPELGIEGSPANALFVDAFNRYGRNPETILALAHILFGVRDPFESLTASELRQVIQLAEPHERPEWFDWYDWKREAEDEARFDAMVAAAGPLKSF